MLHVVRFARDQLDAMVRHINATDYGLTLGVHSRIDETIDFIATRVHVGNVYVNRSMIGAVVGVQPFGGEGKSGTGPKAGGPLYLHRLRRQAPVSLARIGGLCEQGVSAALQVLADWAQQTGRRALAELYMDYAILRTPLVHSIPLPRPTGDSNTLTFAPCGEVACVANDKGALLEPHWTHAAIAAVYAGPAEDAYRLRNELAARDGARIPLITADGGDFPLYRLTAERVVSVNTTAAGGNASLMTLGV